MFKRLIVAALMSLLLVHSALAQTSQVGVYDLPNTTPLTVPVTNATVLWDSTLHKWRYYNGSLFVDAHHPPGNFVATTVPGAGQDNTQGYSVGSFWLNTLTNIWYICQNNSTGAAVWVTPFLSIGSNGVLVNTGGGIITQAPLLAGNGGTGLATFGASFPALLIATGATTASAFAPGSGNQILSMNGAGTALSWITPPGGTVTSVGATGPAGVFTWSGTPVTSTGTLTAAAASIAAHTWLGNNTGSTAAWGAQSITSSDLPAAVAAAQFGGNGAAGAISITTNTTDTGPVQRNATTFSLTGVSKLTLLAGAIINATSTVTVGDGVNAGSITVLGPSTGGGAGTGGPAGSGGTIGFGFCPMSFTGYVSMGGTGGLVEDGGGGGAGIGNGGAAGKHSSTGTSNLQGVGLFGGVSGQPVSWFFVGGFGGGGGGASTVNAGGSTTTPGGKITICANGNVVINASASINATPATPSAPASTSGVSSVGAGGAGGPGGGSVAVYTLGTINNASLISANGGAGGAGGADSTGSGTGGGGGGGGGGAGQVFAMAGGAITGTPTAAGGAGGAGGADAGGTAGSAGSTGSGGSVLTYANTPPNFPLMVLNTKWRACEWQIAALHRDIYQADNARNNTSMMAAFEVNSRHGTLPQDENICFMQIQNQLLTQRDPIGEPLPSEIAKAINDPIDAPAVCAKYTDNFVSKTIDSDGSGVYCLGDYLPESPTS